ncbi:MAG: hypothetical protein AB7V46_19975 [Thermomicrobiales bacterium]
MTITSTNGDDIECFGAFWVGPDGMPRAMLTADDRYAIPVDVSFATNVGNPTNVRAKLNETATRIRPAVSASLQDDLLISLSPSVASG